MFQIAYFVICISFVESSVNGYVIINNKDDESSLDLWNQNTIKTTVTGEQSETNYNNLPTDTKTPIPVSDLVLSIQQEIDNADYNEKKNYEELLMNLKNMLISQPCRYTQIFFRNMWYPIDLGIFGSHQRTRSLSNVDIALASLTELLKWIITKIFEYWPLSGSTPTTEIEHDIHPDSVAERYEMKGATKHPDQPTQKLETPPLSHSIDHKSGSTPAPSPFTTHHQVTHKFEINPIKVTIDFQMTNRIINESKSLATPSPHSQGKAPPPQNPIKPILPNKTPGTPHNLDSKSPTPAPSPTATKSDSVNKISTPTPTQSKPNSVDTTPAPSSTQIKPNPIDTTSAPSPIQNKPNSDNTTTPVPSQTQVKSDSANISQTESSKQKAPESSITDTSGVPKNHSQSTSENVQSQGPLVVHTSVSR